MARLTQLIGLAIDRLAVGLFCALFVIVLAQVFFRYILNSPLIWSEELARYIFVWISFLGWLMATRDQDHIVLTMLRDRLPARARTAWLVVIELAHLGFALILLVTGWRLALRNLSVATVTLPVPFTIVYAVVPVMAALTVVLCLARLSRPTRGQKGPPR